MNVKENFIRNFCIIAHIDHGKSTLADRLLEWTGTVAKRDMTAQLLDSMELERERGITIKLTPTRMKYEYKGNQYILNLIDTPGHVDFTYEVSRSLTACEGAILIVDATQGVEAQTLSNAYLAIDNKLEILPVINKIDLASADIEKTRRDISGILGIESGLAPAISAKNGTNIDEVLEQVIELLPPPNGDAERPLKALLFDSYYNNFTGAVCFVRIFDGNVRKGDRIKMFATGKEYEVVDVGYFTPKQMSCEVLSAGDVGYIAASIKTVNDLKIGDTITLSANPCDKALAGYKEVKPVVFAGIYPISGDKYTELKDALDKLKLNDASLEFAKESSAALGFGFRCGFLGLLHMEIITERLEREFNLEIITTAPSVNYRVHKTNGGMIEISNPSNFPKLNDIDFIEEPIVNVKIFAPPEYIGNLTQLAIGKRGIYKGTTYNSKEELMSDLESGRAVLEFIMPLNEIVYDFFDKMKSSSHGYASLDYDDAGFQRTKLVKMDILLNGKICDALSVIVCETKAYEKGRALTEKLKEVIPRQMFEIPIQAVIGGKVVARETVKAMRKDVLAKCYGGDITRKMKLLEKQKEGKKKMRTLGNVEIPSEAFVSILKI
ncbi:MAG: translation elongation factor 4 [Christensenellaceae bacterium]|nr:translation elongation factor 4 [Christensenellaceae bacterium]